MNTKQNDETTIVAACPLLSAGLGWEPIANAPKDGTIIRLRDKNRIYNCVMAWDIKKKLWTGMAYGIMGASRTYWDESFCPIFEWQHVGPNAGVNSASAAGAKSGD